MNEAIADSARAGGRAAAAVEAEGYYIEPTVLRVEPSRHAIWRTEVFGPVLSVATFRDEAEAIALANGTAFGLAAAVLTADAARERVAEAMEAGIVWVQCSQPIAPPRRRGAASSSRASAASWAPLGSAASWSRKQVTTYVSKNPLGWYTLPGEPLIEHAKN